MNNKFLAVIIMGVFSGVVIYAFIQSNTEYIRGTAFASIAYSSLLYLRPDEKRKNSEVSWHTRTIHVYVNGDYSHSVSFVEALTYQRDIVARLLASLHRNGFEMVAPTDDGAWVYEGWGV